MLTEYINILPYCYGNKKEIELFKQGKGSQVCTQCKYQYECFNHSHGMTEDRKWK
jgi:hypothetical protein